MIANTDIWLKALENHCPPSTKFVVKRLEAENMHEGRVLLPAAEHHGKQELAILKFQRAQVVTTSLVYKCRSPVSQAEEDSQLLEA